MGENMSFNIAATSAVTGLGLTAYGCYKFATAAKEDGQQQRKDALKFMAAGVAAFALGAGIIYSGTAAFEGVNGTQFNTSVPQNNTASVNGIQFSASVPQDIPTPEQIASCNMTKLEALLEHGGHTGDVFKVLNETQGISCNNFLPYKKIFVGPTGYVDGVQQQDMTKPVMWGIDEFERPFVAMKYLCNKSDSEFGVGGVAKGAFTLFQRYTDIPQMIRGEHMWKPEQYCYLGSFDPSSSLRDTTLDTKLSHLRDLLSGITCQFSVPGLYKWTVELLK
jgi:hypothetical protein